MNQKNFYLGLDIGTSSVGFAVTDDQYNLIRKKGKHLWGSRLFSEAQTAEGRRLNRSIRRRYQRRRERINLLRDIFAPEIAKIDPNFYKRLDYSALHQEDKPISNLGISLLEGTMSDSTFYKLYPTIYHLRYALLNEKDKKFDIRLIYLAFSHMLKYRGNFLREGDIGQSVKGSEITSLFSELNNSLKNVDEFADCCFNCDEKTGSDLLNAFKTISRKAELFDREKELLKPSKNLEELLRLINGGSISIKKVFPVLIENNPELKDIKIEFDQDDYESIITPLPDEYQSLLLKAKSLNDLRLLVVLLGDSSSLSEAMKKIYDDHKIDLLTLKKLYKKYVPDKYSEMFLEHGNNLSNYGAYVGRYFEKDTRKRKDLERTKDGQANFYKKVKEDLGFAELFESKVDAAILDEQLLVKKEDLKSIKEKIDNGTFLSIQNGRTNGVIPYQLNKNEMRTIIENQSKFYLFLADKAKSFINPEKEEYKLISLLEYKIPYYVGPLSVANSKNAWMVRKADGKIDPWNFHDLVDTSKTAEQFISRMKNSCSYLRNESTMPKYSLLNLEFQINNELNNVYIGNNKSLSYEDKQLLFNELYKKNKTISVALIRDTLNKYYGKKVELRPKKSDDEDKLKDILKTSFTSYYDFADDRGFGEGFEKNEELYKKAEAIIELITLFEDKSVLKRELKKKKLTDSQIDYFASLNYKGWSSFSRKLLINKSDAANPRPIDILSLPTTDGGDSSKCVPETIFNLVKHTNKNFMQVLNDPDYEFEEAIKKYNEDKDVSIEKLIEYSYLSPSMKRAVRQTYKIIDELKRILKIDKFDRIFVECTRTKEKDPKKKDSRRDNLLKAYEAAKKVVKEEQAYYPISQCKEMLKDENKWSNDKLRSKKIFLYFAQLGHSVYSGKPIDLENLNDYDIDHIIPQALIKDDSFVNTVLVEKEINNRKQDAYPFASSFVTPEGKKWIEFLNRTISEYMSSEKKNRILRLTELSDEEKEGFINRQLTTTNQSVKAVCSLLNETDPNTTIVYSKANLVSDFRNIFGLLKIRSLNNFHHANDAYLNIVVGNVYYEKFNNLQTKKYIEEQKANDPDFKLFTDAKSLFTFNNVVLSRCNSGEVVWHRTLTEEQKALPYRERDPKLVGGTIDLVRKTLSWNDVMVTNMLETVVGKQGFFN